MLRLRVKEIAESQGFRLAYVSARPASVTLHVAIGITPALAFARHGHSPRLIWKHGRNRRLLLRRSAGETLLTAK